jgi:hypothetical protein
MIQHPSFFRVVSTDYTACSSLLTPFVLGAFYLYLSLTEETPVELIVPIMFAAGAVIAVIVLFWRIQLFNTIFSDGMTATATISKIWFYRDRGRINYTYFYLGQNYTSGNVVMKVKKARQIQMGDQLTVMINRNNPKQAYIRDLYL